MPMRRINLVKEKQGSGAPAVEHLQLNQAFDAVRAELKVPGDFPPEALAEAMAAVGAASLPQRDETAAAVPDH